MKLYFNNIKIILFIILFMHIGYCTGFCAGRIGKPMKPYPDLSIQDGEYIRYSQYRAGEHWVDIYILTKIDTQQNKAMIYVHRVVPGEEDKIPKSYEEFGTQVIMDLTTGSMLYSIDAYNRQSKSSDLINGIYEKIEVNRNEHIAYVSHKEKKENLEQMSRSRIKLKSNYPVLTLTSMILGGLRYFDINSSGVFCIIEPHFLKNTIPCTLEFTGKEKITTNAGEFNTIKVKFIIKDPFIGALMSRFTKSMKIWIEDSPRKLIVKTTGEYEVFIDTISTWEAKFE